MVCRSVPGWHICETAQRYRNQVLIQMERNNLLTFILEWQKKVNEDFIESLWKCISVPELLPKLDCSKRDTLVCELCVCVPGSQLHWEWCVLWSVKAEEISSSVCDREMKKRQFIRSSSISPGSVHVPDNTQQHSFTNCFFFYSDTLIILFGSVYVFICWFGIILL